LRGRKICPRCRRHGVIATYARMTDGSRPDLRRRRWTPIGWWCQSCGWVHNTYPTLESLREKFLKERKAAGEPIPSFLIDWKPIAEQEEDPKTRS